MSDLEVHLVGRGAEEYFLYPRRDVTCPMTTVGVHKWFKRCLERVELPSSVKLHEMRPSAADNLWRRTSNLAMAQQLLRHESPATTAAYLHPTYDDLKAALEGARWGERASVKASTSRSRKTAWNSGRFPRT